MIGLWLLLFLFGLDGLMTLFHRIITSRSSTVIIPRTGLWFWSRRIFRRRRMVMFSWRVIVVVPVSMRRVPLVTRIVVRVRVMRMIIGVGRHWWRNRSVMMWSIVRCHVTRHWWRRTRKWRWWWDITMAVVWRAWIIHWPSIVVWIVGRSNNNGRLAFR